MRLLWLPVRRVELLFSLLLLICSFLMLIMLNLGLTEWDTSWLALLVLEMLLPLTMGFMAAGLLAGDPALDLVLSAARPSWRALGERLLVLGSAGACLGVGFLLLSYLRNLTLPGDGLERIVIWLSPMVFCLGLSSAAALLRGRMLDGVLVSTGVMMVSLISLQPIMRWCALNYFQASCPLWLISPVMTLGNPQDDYWPFNRLLWLALGVALLALSFRLVQREEQLLEDRNQE